MPARRRLLIVSPHFPPVNAADAHRVRHALPHLREHGWEPTVLAVRPDEVRDAVIEPLLEQTYPSDVRIIRTGALPLRWLGRFGMSTLGWRCVPAIAAAGARLLAAERFDAAFFSTTQFPVMALGPRWLQRFGVPYFLDFQDPWASDYHRTAGRGVRPPGGAWKYRLAQWQARRLEGRVVRRAAGSLCVSAAYPAMLRRRYPEVADERFEVLPFAGSPEDFAVMERAGVPQSIFDPADGCDHWVYAGRGQADMERAIDGILGGFGLLRERRPAWAARARLHFVGTAYAGTARTVEPIAARFGLGQTVREIPRRIGYFEVLRCLRDAAGLLLPGSDDPGYTASKLYPCLLAGKPLLAVLHRSSGAAAAARGADAVEAVTFGGNGHDREPLSRAVAAAWERLLDGSARASRDALAETFSPAAMTLRMAAAFARWLAPRPALANG